MIPRCPAIDPVSPGAYPEYDVVVSSRLRLDRNLEGFHFPWIAPAEENAAARERMRLAAERAGFVCVDTGRLDAAERSELAERGIASRPYLIDDAKCMAFSPDRSLWAIFNDSAHCSLQSSLPGLSLSKAWELASGADDLFEAELGWAFDPVAGYVQADGIRCGTGLCASVLLHLPALSMSGLTDTVFRRVMEAGFIVEGSYATRAPSAGSLFSIALPEPYREPERASLERLEKTARLIAEYERRARADALGKAPWELRDSVGRAFGLLSNAYLLSREESADIVSGIRLGLAMDVLSGMDMAEATELWVSLRLARGEGDNAWPDAAIRAKSARRAASRIRVAKGFDDV